MPYPNFFPIVPPVSTMTLAIFTASVSDDIARGQSVAARLPSWIRAASQWLEQNYTFGYMKKVGQLDLPANTNSLVFPSYLLKDLLGVRPISGVSGEATYLGEPLPSVDPADVMSIDATQIPQGYYRQGTTLVFDARPPLLQSFAVGYSEYTPWPTVGGSQPTLLLRYENLLRAQTMVNAWRVLKDFEAMAVWKTERDEALRAVLVAEDEATWQGQDLWMDPK